MGSLGDGFDPVMIIDDDDELDDLPDQADITEVIEEISVEERPTVEELPPTTPPPTLTDNSDMDSPIQIHTTKTDDRQVSIFAQPGILAAFIGGAVVGLLCAILLVMFIVYRMRKKDEGSYPLDEPKRMPLTSSYSPNDKEIYA
ncbi:Syndecan-like [Homarus americanus]|uniref:Syndecan n=1 Tax=Homarus americanus TaxID=6706 RepID=A0A8J5MR25_HOMAM|nr:Syndecan-like [Homarus americanus]